MNTAKELYDRWLAQPELDTAVAEELHGIAGDDAAITDRFYRDLEFGTGGLRGVLGAGTNRMNLYTVRKATQGLADYLNATDLPKKIAIAHDSRNNGELFTREAARVLAANDITACVYPRLEPTPALSWAVRYLGCGAGVCITASRVYLYRNLLIFQAVYVRNKLIKLCTQNLYLNLYCVFIICHSYITPSP